jgi:hypothetical protein
LNGKLKRERELLEAKRGRERKRGSKNGKKILKRGKWRIQFCLMSLSRDGSVAKAEIKMKKKSAK